MLEGTAEACGGRILQLQAPVAQLAARRSHNPKVASSILVEGSPSSYGLAWL